MRDNFWFITLCVFLLIAVNAGWNIPLRIAVASNAVLIIINVIRQSRRIYCEHRKTEDNHIDPSESAV